MDVVAYCRVSTNKEDQLNSLEAQKKFFMEYVGKTDDHLIEIYADEGLSGTKTRNRAAFNRMMQDARKGLFGKVLVKDISRMARNTVDLLENLRILSSLNITVQFISGNLTNMGGSELLVTVFAAVAQEESANTSKRVKFGKRLNMEKGKVPNYVYGYEKRQGDYFSLTVVEKEADIVRRIFSWYTEEGYGACKIAHMLNAQGYRTKRGCEWSQNAICRILTNQIYIGVVINGRQEVDDFLTGRRKEKDESEWYKREYPELRIIDPDVFKRAQELMKSRHDLFKTNHERSSNVHPFSTIIRCKECGRSFRQVYRNRGGEKKYIKWTCSFRNGNGVESCPNTSRVDEEELYGILKECFVRVLCRKKDVLEHIVSEFKKVCKADDEELAFQENLQKRISKVYVRRERVMYMYEEDLITKGELAEKLKALNEELDALVVEQKKRAIYLSRENDVENELREMFKSIEDLVDVHQFTNAQLKSVIEKIEVDKEGVVDVYFRSPESSGLDSFGVSGFSTGAGEPPQKTGQGA